MERIKKYKGFMVVYSMIILLSFGMMFRVSILEANDQIEDNMIAVSN